MCRFWRHGRDVGLHAIALLLAYIRKGVGGVRPRSIHPMNTIRRSVKEKSSRDPDGPEGGGAFYYEFL